MKFSFGNSQTFDMIVFSNSKKGDENNFRAIFFEKKFLNVSPERDVPDYCDVDHKKMSGSLTRIPLLEDVPYSAQMEPNLVVEYYSR